MSRTKIALVTGFSETCLPLLKQCVISAYLSSQLSKLDIELTAYCYEYNWMGLSFLESHSEKTSRDYTDYSDFERNTDLSTELKQLTDLKIVTKKASEISHNRKCYLPDIKIYHDFAEKHLNQFEYAIFCHNDVVFNENYNLFDEMITIIYDSNFAFIGEPHLDYREALSLRIYPHFIFVCSSRFVEYGLSFINDYKIFDDNIRSWSIAKDGGAQLLASCYSKNNPKNNSNPCAVLDRKWFSHLRLHTDTGVESSKVATPHHDALKKLLESADRYSDLRLYGKVISGSNIC